MKIVSSHKPPYVTTDALARFPADMTVFQRLDNDPDFAGRICKGERRKTDDFGTAALSSTAFRLSGTVSRAAYGLNPAAERISPTTLPIEVDETTVTCEIKHAAHFFGAAQVGVARANSYWLYTKLAAETEAALKNLHTVVVIAIAMDREMIARSPGIEADAATGNGYAKMAFVVAGVAEYIRTCGYTALGCGNDTALSIPLAIDAGLGEMGRNGLLTTPEHGSCVRICKVFTDMPLVPDKPVSFGMKERCEACGSCVSACPVGAISKDKQTDVALNASSNAGVLKWPVNGEKCRSFWHTNGTTCSNCIDACPVTPR